MDDELIPISALNHFLYCPRRCALIHMEQAFAENVHTLRGNALHENADEVASSSEEGVRIERALPFFRIHSGSGGSHAGLGLSLVRAIAQILDLRFDLDLTEDHRLVARITGFRPLAA